VAEWGLLDTSLLKEVKGALRRFAVGATNPDHIAMNQKELEIV
jgi:hypothetical protein